MAKIIGISGALRKGSYNAALLRAAVELAPEGLGIEIASIRELPVYDGDVEAAAFPDVVRALKDRIAGADGLLLVTPEYNNGVPGSFKNAIDWLSRPSKDTARVFGGKPVALMGATPGGGGTILAQAAWLPILRTLGTNVFAGPRVMIAHCANVFDESGTLKDEPTRAQVKKLLDGFAAFIAHTRAG